MLFLLCGLMIVEVMEVMEVLIVIIVGDIEEDVFLDFFVFLVEFEVWIEFLLYEVVISFKELEVLSSVMLEVFY